MMDNSLSLVPFERPAVIEKLTSNLGKRKSSTPQKFVGKQASDQPFCHSLGPEGEPPAAAAAANRPGNSLTAEAGIAKSGHPAGGGGAAPRKATYKCHTTQPLGHNRNQALLIAKQLRGQDCFKNLSGCLECHRCEGCVCVCV